MDQEFESPQAAAASWVPARDRRRTRRLKVAVPARIRPYYQSPGLSEELLTATNLSRDGFYFISRRPAYHADMNLYVGCPAGHSHAAAEADCARVVRVEPLGGDAWGVAVTFHRSACLYHGGEFPSQK